MKLSINKSVTDSLSLAHRSIGCMTLAGWVVVMSIQPLLAESSVDHDESSTDAAWVHVPDTSHDEPYSLSSPKHEIPMSEDSLPLLHGDEFYEAGTDLRCASEGPELTCDDCVSHNCECHGVDTDPGYPRKPHRTMPGDRSRGDCPPLRYRMDDQQRSGNSASIASWAQCGRKNTKYGRYTAWFVGGGAAFAKVPTLPLQLLSRGRDRKAIACGQHGEGTWGLDYEGLFGYSKVWLKYTQGRKQGGEGRYQTDGEPKLIAKIKETLLHKDEH